MSSKLGVHVIGLLFTMTVLLILIMKQCFFVSYHYTYWVNSWLSLICLFLVYVDFLRCSTSFTFPAFSGAALHHSSCILVASTFLAFDKDFCTESNKGYLSVVFFIYGVFFCVGYPDSPDLTRLVRENWFPLYLMGNRSYNFINSSLNTW